MQAHQCSTLLRAHVCRLPSTCRPVPTKTASVAVSACTRTHIRLTANRPVRRVGPRGDLHVMCAEHTNSAKQPFVLVGTGRVGSALADLGDGSDKFVKRGEAVNGPAGPIIVCTRNNDLQGVLDSTPEDRRDDLVFIQNGMLQPWLDARGLGDNTQALVYFAVSKKGAKPIDGKTVANPEGLTGVTGKHAQAFADRLAAGDLSCKVLDRTQYKKAMLEKLIWISAVMLVGTKNGNISVGEVEKDHKDEVTKLINELAASGEAELSIKLDKGTVERLLAYSRSVADFPTAVKEVPWRNGWFLDISMQAEQEGKPDPSPTHTAWLKEVGAV